MICFVILWGTEYNCKGVYQNGLVANLRVTYILEQILTISAHKKSILGVIKKEGTVHVRATEYKEMVCLQCVATVSKTIEIVL